MNLKFKSTEADLKFNIQSQFRILNQNILYITHVVDRIDIKLSKLENENKLQMQVSDYYDDKDTENIPEVKDGSNSSGN